MLDMETVLKPRRLMHPRTARTSPALVI